MNGGAARREGGKWGGLFEGQVAGASDGAEREKRIQGLSME